MVTKYKKYRRQMFLLSASIMTITTTAVLTTPVVNADQINGLNSTTASSETAVNQYMYIHNGGNMDVYANAPSGLTGSNLDKRNWDNKRVLIEAKKVLSNGEAWYRFTDNGVQYYVKASEVSTFKQDSTVSSNYVVITGNGTGHGYMVKSDGTVGGAGFSLSNYHGKGYFTNRKVTDDNNVTYYQVNSGNMRFYLNASDVRVAIVGSGAQTPPKVSPVEQKVKPKFAVNAQVMVTPTASKATDGTDLTAKRNQTAVITDNSKTASDNKQATYSLRFTNGSVVNNVMERDLVATPYANFQTVDTTMVVNQNTSSLYTVAPNGAVGSTRYNGSLANNQKVHVVGQVTTLSDNKKWSILDLNGSRVYVDSAVLSPYVAPVSRYNVGDKAMVRSVATGAVNGANIVFLQNQVVTIVSKVAFDASYSHFYYNVKTSGGRVYSGILEQDLIDDPYSSDVTVNQTKFIRTDRNDGLYANTPWNEAGSVYYDSATKYAGQQVTVKRQVVTRQNGVTWDLITVNGHDVFIDARGLTNTQPSKFNVGDKAMVRSVATGAVNGANIVFLQNQVVTIVSKVAFDASYSHFYYSVKTSDGRVYSGILEQDLIDDPYSSDVTVNQTKFIRTDRNDGLYANTPWNEAGSVYYDSATKYAGQQVTVKRQVVTRQNGVTWDLITINGHDVFIDARGLTNTQPSKFNVGGLAYVAGGAIRTSTGQTDDLVARRGQSGTIISKTLKPFSSSQWQYTIRFQDGFVQSNVLEQDLSATQIYKVNMDKAIDWFEQRKGKLTYSMYGSRNGSDGTADCSGSMTQALKDAGASNYKWLYNTESIHDYLTANGFKLIVENSPSGWNAQRGDIVIWGKRGDSSGAGGHIGIITSNENDPYFISTCYITHGQPGTAVQEVRYNEYAQRNGYPYYYVYRQVQ